MTVSFLFNSFITIVLYKGHAVRIAFKNIIHTKLSSQFNAFERSRLIFLKEAKSGERVEIGFFFKKSNVSLRQLSIFKVIILKEIICSSCYHVISFISNSFHS